MVKCLRLDDGEMLEDPQRRKAGKTCSKQLHRILFIDDDST